MNHYTSTTRASLALLVVGFGLLGPPYEGPLRTAAMSNPDADTVAALADGDLAALSEEDAAYVRAMQEHLK